MLRLLALFFAVTSFVVAQPNANSDQGLTASEIQNWRTDLEYIKTEFPKRHADLFHRLSEKQFYGAIEALNKQIPSLSEKQIALEMGRIVGMANDGHTNLKTLEDPNLSFRFFPLRFYVFEKGTHLISVDKKYANLLGAKLISIGSVPAEQAIEKVNAYIAGDNHFGRWKKAPYYLASPDVLKHLGLSASDSSAVFTFEKDGRARTVKISLDANSKHGLANIVRSSENWLDVRDVSGKKRALSAYVPGKQHWFKYISDSRTMYVQMNTVTDSKEKTLAKFFEEVFEETKKVGAEKFVLDLRYNGGGNNQLIRPVLRGLIQMKQIDQRGKFFVFIGRQTFSAAQNLVNQLETWTNAKFVGEPTGSHVNLYGDAMQFKLPNSGLRLWISSLYWQNKHAKDSRRWTAPNIAAEPNFEDYSNNLDPAMRAIENFADGPSLEELAMKRYRQMDFEGFRKDVISFRKNPANKYVDVEGQINRYGYNMIQMSLFDAAIRLFKINTELFPKSSEAYASLGEGYAWKKMKVEAVKNLKKSLALNPKNEKASKMLKKLRLE